jgi:hypothetical protein
MSVIKENGSVLGSPLILGRTRASSTSSRTEVYTAEVSTLWLVTRHAAS